jgi:hypothetical protein
MSSVPQLMNRDSSPESSAFRGLRTVRISPEAPLLLMSSRISASRTVNQRPFGARGISMRPIRKHRDNPARPRRRLAWHSATSRIWPTQIEAGRPPRAQSVLSSLGRKTPYARRKRERVISVWGREARAFTLNRGARRFRARPSISRGLRPLIGSRVDETGFERKLGFRLPRRTG